MTKKRISASSKTKKKALPAKQDAQSRFNYFVKSEYYPPEYVNKVFKSRLGSNWHTIQDKDLPALIKSGQRIDYIYLDGSAYYDKRYFGLLSNIKNMVSANKKVVTLKNNLVRELSRKPVTAKYIMPQIELDMLDVSLKSKVSSAILASLKSKLSSGKTPYIFKPVTGFAGSGIITVTTYQALYKYIQQVIQKYRHSWGAGVERNRIWVLQEYITNPLLLLQPDGKEYKFHIRHYFIYFPKGISYYTKQGEVAVARAPYKEGNWDDKRIHDTHFYGRDGDKWPEVLDLAPAILADIDKQIANLYMHICSVLNRNRVGCYTESRSCFELFGVDLMITADYQVKIIELNTKIGLASNLTEISRDLFEGCLDLIVTPGLLKTQSPDPAKYGFIKIG